MNMSNDLKAPYDLKPRFSISRVRGAVRICLTSGDVPTCVRCPYNLDAVCFLDVVNDLHKHAKRLKEENDKLKEENKELMVRLFLSEQSM